MPQANTPTELIALVADELKSVGPTAFGTQGSGRHGAPRRFVWVPLDSGMRGPRRTSGSGVHVLDGVDLRFSVECWGHNFDDAFLLVCTLLTAIQKAWGGRQYQCDNLHPWEQQTRDTGFVLAVQLELRLDLPSVDLSQPLPDPPAVPALVELPAPQAVPLPPETFAPTGETTVQITAVAQATPPLSTPGDGELESEET